MNNSDIVLTVQCTMQIIATYSCIYSFLATGDAYTGLKARFRLGLATVHKCIKETCEAIWEVLKDDVLPTPTEESWKEIAEGFYTKWHFPNCLGALDGKHVMIRKPFNAGSLFFNYKGYHSIVLMALVDHNYRFTYIDIGGYGSNSDGNVFRSSLFGHKLLTNKLKFPGPKALPNFPTGGIVPHVVVADEAFPLTHNIMRPYPRFRESSLPKDQAIYNYRLSRARMVVENAFGILAMRWRLFDRRLALFADNADKVVKACCVLHNFLTPIKHYDEIASELNPEGRSYAHNGMLYLPRLCGYHARRDAQGVREVFRGFFNSPAGALSFQDNRVSFRITNPA